MTAYNDRLPEHRELVEQLARLQLHFLWRVVTERNEHFRTVIETRADIVKLLDPSPRHVDIFRRDYDSPEWTTVVDELERALRDHIDDRGSEPFEDASIAVLDERIDRFARATCGSTAKREVFSGSCVRFDPPNRSDPGTVMFHIYNSREPESLFADPGYVAHDLLRMVDDAERLHGANAIRTDTWLNSVDRWLRFFPDEWTDNLEPEQKDIAWHLGFWGQFITSRGTFNYKRAKYLRSTGEMQYWPRRSRCTIRELRRHLRSGDIGNAVHES